MKKFFFASIFLVSGCFSEAPTVSTSNNGESPNNGKTAATTGGSNPGGTTTPSCVPMDEVCDQKDNDCDGEVDEGLGEACCFSDTDCTDKICDVDSNTCVACLVNTSCTDASAAKCSEFSCAPCETSEDCSHISDKNECLNGACVVCKGDRDCMTDEKCDAEKNVCASCLSDGDCSVGKCLVDVDDPTQNSCVECVANTDCTFANKSLCEATNICGACQANSDCSHLTATPVCNSGSCVECTSDSDCPGTACDLSESKCSSQQLNSIGQCEPCVSDSACLSTHSCILTEYKGSPAGAYCLKKKAGSCARPYSTVISRVSIDGAPAAPHCGVKETLTTCRAARGTLCAFDFSSGHYSCTGGRCRDISTPIQPPFVVCRSACDNNNQCSTSCGGGFCQ